MAIKGKRKTHGRRVIAAPPRPQVVVRKPPIWRRRWIWGLIGALVVGGVAVGLLLKFRADGRVDRRDREIAALRTFADRVRAELPEDIQSVPGGLVVVFPELRQDLESLKEGTLKPAEARSRADEIEGAARGAAEGIEAVAVETVIPAEFEEDRARLQDAKEFLVQSFRIYEDVAGLLVLSIGQTGQEREQLIDRTQSILGRAGSLFDSGFGILSSSLSRLGITTPIVPQQPITPPTPIPSPPPQSPAESPGGSPTPGESPTGEASPSPSP
jgi:hypothetical protein